ncbi:MAG: hypothetical protein H7315_14825 [Herminiimonas sp.]|nr:hypothetical protein [Herminiimonas sp.]
MLVLGAICGWITESRARRYEPYITSISKQYADSLYRRNEFQKFFWKSSIRKMMLVFEQEPEEVRQYVSSMRKMELSSWVLMFLAVMLIVLGWR